MLGHHWTLWMASTWCSEMKLQDLTVLASSRNTQINRTSLVFHVRACCRTCNLSNMCVTSWADVFETCNQLYQNHCEFCSTLLHEWDRISRLERMYSMNLMMKMCQVVIRQCEGYTQHKSEVVDYYEAFRNFLRQIPKVYAPKRKF